MTFPFRILHSTGHRAPQDRTLDTVPDKDAVPDKDTMPDQRYAA